MKTNFDIYAILKNLFSGIMSPLYDVMKANYRLLIGGPMEARFIRSANCVMSTEMESFIKAFEYRDWIAAGHAVERAQVKIVNLAITYDVDMDKYSTPDGISLT